MLKKNNIVSIKKIKKEFDSAYGLNHSFEYFFLELIDKFPFLLNGRIIDNCDLRDIYELERTLEDFSSVNRPYLSDFESDQKKLISKTLSNKIDNIKAVYRNIPLSTYLYIYPILFNLKIKLIDHNYHLSTKAVEELYEHINERYYNSDAIHLLKTLNFNDRNTLDQNDIKSIIEENDTYYEMISLSKLSYLINSGECFLLSLLQKHTNNEYLTKEDFVNEIKLKIEFEKNEREKLCFLKQNISLSTFSLTERQINEKYRRRDGDHPLSFEMHRLSGNLIKQKKCENNVPLSQDIKYSYNVASEPIYNNIKFRKSSLFKVLNRYNPFKKRMRIYNKEIDGGLYINGGEGSGIKKYFTEISTYNLNDKKTSIHITNCTATVFSLYQKAIDSGRRHDFSIVKISSEDCYTKLIHSIQTEMIIVVLVEQKNDSNFNEILNRFIEEANSCEKEKINGLVFSIMNSGFLDQNNFFKNNDRIDELKNNGAFFIYANEDKNTDIKDDYFKAASVHFNNFFFMRSDTESHQTHNMFSHISKSTTKNLSEGLFLFASKTKSYSQDHYYKLSYLNDDIKEPSLIINFGNYKR